MQIFQHVHVADVDVCVCVCIYRYNVSVCCRCACTHFLTRQTHGLTFCCPWAYQFQDHGPRLVDPAFQNQPRGVLFFFRVHPEALMHRPQHGCSLFAFQQLRELQGFPQERRGGKESKLQVSSLQIPI